MLGSCSLAAGAVQHRLFILLVCTTVLGCQDPDERPATWSYLHAAIVVPSCATASCHSSLTRRAGIDLEDPNEAYDVLIGEQFVLPGDVNSSLIQLLEGDERTLMPPDAPLPEADVDLFRAWIEAGALRE